MEELKKEINEKADQLDHSRQETTEMRKKYVDLTIENHFLKTEIENKMSEIEDSQEDLGWMETQSGEVGRPLRRRENIHIFQRQKSRSMGNLTSNRSPDGSFREFDSDPISQTWENSLGSSPPNNNSSNDRQYSSIRRSSAKQLSASRLLVGMEHKACLEQLQSLRQRISEEDEKIAQLKNYIQVLGPTTKLSPKGKIEVGLAFSHITSR